MLKLIWYNPSHCYSFKVKSLDEIMLMHVHEWRIPNAKIVVFHLVFCSKIFFCFIFCYLNRVCAEVMWVCFNLNAFISLFLQIYFSTSLYLFISLAWLQHQQERERYATKTLDNFWRRFFHFNFFQDIQTQSGQVRSDLYSLFWTCRHLSK